MLVRESCGKKNFSRQRRAEKVENGQSERVLCVSGCLMEKDGEKIAQTSAAGIDLVVGTQQLPVFASLLQTFLADRQKTCFYRFNDGGR